VRKTTGFQSNDFNEKGGITHGITSYPVCDRHGLTHAAPRSRAENLVTLQLDGFSKHPEEASIAVFK
jgi:hypothetical protein